MYVLRFLDMDDELHTGFAFDGDTARIIKGNIFDVFDTTNKKAAVQKILAPVHPTAIFCIGLNYRLHAKETGMPIPEHPVVFMKNPGAITGPRDVITIPRSCIDPPQVDYEAELAVVIGRPCKDVTPDEAMDYIFGYTCANDISARRWQKHAGGGQWVRGKSFDTFCPMGPTLVTADEITNPQSLTVECRLNGKLMQESSTSDMIFTIGEIISYLSESTTLMPGTVILTGTPSGVGFTRKPQVYLKPGDVLETSITGMGYLENRVVLESDSEEDEYE